MFQSIQFRFTLIVTLLMTGMLLLVGLIIGRYNEAALEEVAGRRLSLTAETVRHDIESYFDTYVTQLDLLNLLHDFGSDAQHNDLQILLFQSSGLEQLSLVDVDGQEQARFSRTLAFTDDDLRDLSQHPAFLAIQETPTIYYSPVNYDETLREPLITIALPAIDPRSEAVEGVLLVDVRFRTVRELVASQSLPDEMQAFLVSDSLGTIIAHPNPAYVIQATPYETSSHSHRTRSLEGIHVLQAHEAMILGNEAFTIVIEQPVHVALEQVSAARVLSLLVIGLAALGSSLLALLVVRRLTNPIRKLAYTAGMIRAGNLKKRVHVHRQDEIGELAQAFNEMAGRLADMVENLEGLVQSRTRRLKEVEIELRREKDFLQDVMDNSMSAILVVSPAGNILFVNTHAEELLGIGRGYLLNKDFASPKWQPTDFSGNPIANESLPFYRVLNTKQPVSDYEIAVSGVNGNRLYLILNGVPVFDANGTLERMVFTFNDVSLRHKWQNQLEDALAKEKELNEMQSRFVTLISHELRTPLSIILTSADLIERNAERLSPHQMIRRADKIQRQVKRLRHIMNDVIFISKTDQRGHAVQYASVDLRAFCQEIINDLRLTLTDTPQLIANFDHTPAEIISDEVLLHHILSNLLSNAMKYTPTEGQVHLTVTAKEQTLEFVIQDNGMGIPQEHQTRLFQSFVRADNVSNIPGTGLGLVIVQRSVHMLEGTITFESDEGSGTTFTVTLPLMKSLPV